MHSISQLFVLTEDILPGLGHHHLNVEILPQCRGHLGELPATPTSPNTKSTSTPCSTPPSSSASASHTSASAHSALTLPMIRRLPRVAYRGVCPVPTRAMNCARRPVRGILQLSSSVCSRWARHSFSLFGGGRPPPPPPPADEVTGATTAAGGGRAAAGRHRRRTYRMRT